jgi:transcriptional regulator with XRE-family HTH domain
MMALARSEAEKPESGRTERLMAVSGDAAFLGRMLRKSRIAAGITSAEKLAEEWGYERTAIAKAESGQRPPTPQLAALYAKRFPELNNLIASGLIEEWAEFARENTPSSTGNFDTWVDHEEDAAALFYWGPILIPGMSQTERYAREVLSARPSKEPL